MAPLYGWGSTAWKLEPLQGDGLLFTTKFPEFLILILSTLEWWMTESTLEPPSPVILNKRPLDWESNALTTTSLLYEKRNSGTGVFLWTFSRTPFVAASETMPSLIKIIGQCPAKNWNMSDERCFTTDTVVRRPTS